MGIFKKIIYGDENRSDFDTKLLPKNRFEQFFYLIKHNSINLLKYNLIIFLHFIPTIIWLLLSTKFTSLELNKYMAITYIPLLIFIPIGFISLGGIVKIVLKMILDEVVIFKIDYKTGFKENFGFLSITGFIYALSLYGISYLINMASSGAYQVLFLFVFGFITIFTFYLINMHMMYKTKTSNLIRNSLILSFAGMFKNILTTLIAIFPLLLLIINSIFVWGIVLTLSLSFGFIYTVLVTSLNCVNNFDKFINKKSYPTYYRKGLSDEISTEEH